MEAIELSVYGKDKLGKPMVERKQYYLKPEADAEIARLEHQIEVLNADLTRCHESKTAIGDKCLRLEAEVERLKKYTRCYNGVPSEWIVKPEDL